jgi:hypothetical protein
MKFRSAWEIYGRGIENTATQGETCWKSMDYDGGADPAVGGTTSGFIQSRFQSTVSSPRLIPGDVAGTMNYEP